MAVPEQQFKDILDHIEQLIKETIAKELQNLTLPSPAPTSAPNPLAFYETILKVASFQRFGASGPSPSVYPYFSDVYNAVVRYFGGPKTTDPIGKKFKKYKLGFLILRMTTRKKQSYSLVA